METGQIEYGLTNELVQPLVVSEIEKLLQVNELAPLHPEKFWNSPVKVHRDLRQKRATSFPIDINCSPTDGVSVWIDYPVLEEQLHDYADANAMKREELLQCYLAIGLVHDLSFRALQPEKVDNFLEKATNPHGMLNTLLGTKMIDSEDNFSVISEFFMGDEDRVARVNMFRFAIAMASIAHQKQDPSCGERFESLFRQHLEARINSASSYMLTVHERFRLRKEKAITMYAEHIDEFQLATVLPLPKNEIEQYISLLEN